MESLNTIFLPPKSQTPLRSLYLKLQESVTTAMHQARPSKDPQLPGRGTSLQQEVPAGAQHKTSMTAAQVIFC